jgi:hypothetical protein
MPYDDHVKREAIYLSDNIGSKNTDGAVRSVLVLVDDK